MKKCGRTMIIIKIQVNCQSILMMTMRIAMTMMIAMVVMMVLITYPYTPDAPDVDACQPNC